MTKSTLKKVEEMMPKIKEYDANTDQFIFIDPSAVEGYNHAIEN